MAEPDVPDGDVERFEQFLIVVGNICSDGALAHLEVCVRTITGQELTGPVKDPTPTSSSDPQVNDTGYGPWLTIGTATVQLTDIVACQIRAPSLQESSPTTQSAR